MAKQVDLLPKGTNTEEVAQWLERSAAQKRLSPIATFLVSSRTSALLNPCISEHILNTYNVTLLDDAVLGSGILPPLHQLLRQQGNSCLFCPATPVLSRMPLPQVTRGWRDLLL